MVGSGSNRLIVSNTIEASEAVRVVGKENSELHEELSRLQHEYTWLVRGLTYISQMPNPAAEIAKKVLGFKPYRS